MNAMLVGADKLGNIPDVLADFGIRIAQHISGRYATHQRKFNGLPKNTDLVILFTDFLGHNVMKTFRDAARREGLPVVACRRSTCSVKKSLECLNLPCANCPMAKRAAQLRALVRTTDDRFTASLSEAPGGSIVYLSLPRHNR